MERTWIMDYDPANCAIGAAVSIIGERATFLVLREAFNGVRRFADIKHRTGIPGQRPAQPARVPSHREGPGPVSRAGRADAVGRQTRGPAGRPPRPAPAPR